MSDKINCKKCKWSWKKEDGGDDLYICHKCGCNNFYTSNDLFKPNKINNNKIKNNSKLQFNK